MATALVSKAVFLPLPGQQRKSVQHQSRVNAKGLSLGWNSSFCAPQFSACPLVQLENRQVGVARAAWTRRSKSALDPPKNRKSWKQRHEKYLKPFMLDVFISHKYIHAKVMHRVTSKVVSVATTNAKELRFSLQSLTDENACKTIDPVKDYCNNPRIDLVLGEVYKVSWTVSDKRNGGEIQKAKLVTVAEGSISTILQCL